MATENPCAAFYGKVANTSAGAEYSSAVDKYYAIDSKSLQPLRQFRELGLKEQLFSENTKISQQQLVKTMGTEWSARFPQDGDRLTSIYNFSWPYRESGSKVEYIDFKIWDRDWGRSSFVHDRDTPFLRRLPFDDFYQLIQRDYRAHLKRKRFVLVRGENSGLELAKIQSALDSEIDSITLTTVKGESRTASLKDLMRWNVGMKDSERVAFAKFFESGGTGQISRVEPSAGRGQSGYQGYYLVVKDLPPPGTGDTPLADPFLRPMLESLIGKLYVWSC